MRCPLRQEFLPRGFFIRGSETPLIVSDDSPFVINSGFFILFRYNNKTYRVDDIKWDKHPTDTFKCTEKGVEVEKSFIEYYQKVCSCYFVSLVAELCYTI